MLGAEFANAHERRLVKHFRALKASDREALNAFAEFLVQRQARDDSLPEDQPCAASDGPQQPHEREPRPKTESVIAAMKRLRRSYPRIDTGDLLNEASLLMSAHMLQGRPAAEVIDALEELFACHARECSRAAEP